eukprot:CAMPEP_0115001702 /NCGR_PEP_ID=MMETSP0216-20121206/17550_1 /TAXON_ID=223996 /ORGANISM="Protocruzia adherens, Strain Boccale" /LENGTH=308 /DNA_ID=CAMNT_0002367121 /DNA_START=232 /DNA_END=1158 /DNA_ORIENTATION=-
MAVELVREGLNPSKALRCYQKYKTSCAEEDWLECANGERVLNDFENWKLLDTDLDSLRMKGDYNACIEQCPKSASRFQCNSLCVLMRQASVCDFPPDSFEDIMLPALRRNFPSSCLGDCVQNFRRGCDFSLLSICTNSCFEEAGSQQMLKDCRNCFFNSLEYCPENIDNCMMECVNTFGAENCPCSNQTKKSDPNFAVEIPKTKGLECWNDCLLDLGSMCSSGRLERCQERCVATENETKYKRVGQIEDTGVPLNDSDERLEPNFIQKWWLPICLMTMLTLSATALYSRYRKQDSLANEKEYMYAQIH